LLVRRRRLWHLDVEGLDLDLGKFRHAIIPMRYEPDKRIPLQTRRSPDNILEHDLDLVAMRLSALLLAQNLARHNVRKRTRGHRQDHMGVHPGHGSNQVNVLDPDGGIVTIGTPDPVDTQLPVTLV